MPAVSQRFELLRSAVASAPIILWTADTQGVLTLFEGRGVEQLGLAQGQLVGTSVLEYFRSRPEMQAQVRRALAGETVHFESFTGGKAYEHWIEPLRPEGGHQAGIVGATIDVTLRHHALVELRQSEEQFRALAEGSVQGVIIHRDWKYLFVNHAYARMLGYGSPEEMYAIPSVDAVVAPEERARLREFSRQRYAGEPAPEIYESVSLRKDGSRMDHLIYSRRIQWRGAPAIQSTLVDISERKQAERALLHSQRLLTTVFDAIPHPMVVKDKADQYLMVNRAFTETIGLTAEEMKPLGTARFPGRPSEEIQEVEAENRRVLAGSVSRIEVERALTTRSAGKRYVHGVKVPLKDADGSVTGLVAIAMDVTERRQAEADLREKEWMLSRAAQVAGIGTWFREIKSGKLRWSEETYRILGVDPTTYDSTANGYFTLIHPEDRAEYVRLRAEVEQRGGTFRHEHRILRPDGSTRIVMVMGERYNDGSGDPVGVIGIFQDVTDQRVAEARLLHSEKMETVGRLTAGVAHDFNNLLTVIRGNLELMARSLGESPVVRPFVESVLAAADRGTGLVRQLSAIARKQPLQSSVIKLGPVLTTLTSLLNGTLGSGIQVQTDIADDIWEVRVDTAQLQSAVLNLGINARDAMPKGGTLTLSAGNVTLSGTDLGFNRDAAPGEYVMVSVADTGTGIPEPLRDQVFEPFFTTKRPGEGTGLGLSMVFGFVRQSGGHIRLHSEVDRGTTIHLYFPRVVDLPGAAAGSAAELTKGRPLRSAS